MIYFNVEPGAHYISVKFVKDESVNSGNDSLKFMPVLETYEIVSFNDTTKTALEEANLFVDCAAPHIDVDTAGLVTASVINREGVIESGITNGTYQLPTVGQISFTPGRYGSTLARSGNFLTGNVSVLGDENFVASNIANGVTIFGVTGTYEGSSSSSSSNITTATVQISMDQAIRAVAYTSLLPSSGLLDSTMLSPNTTSVTLSNVAVGSIVAFSTYSSYGTQSTGTSPTSLGSYSLSSGTMRFYKINGDCTIESLA